MTSINLRKVAADSNVLLSALAGQAALQILTHPDIEAVTTRFNVNEIERWLPRMASKYGLDIEPLFIQLRMLPVKIFEESAYKSHFSKAAKFLKDRDPDDIHLAALALKEGACIWSNDKDFENLPIPVYPTARLIRMIQD